MIGVIVLLLVISGILSGCGDDENEESAIEPERISIDELKSLMDNQADVVVVDVRSAENYNAGHIPGAILMTFPSDIRSRYHELPEDKTIILYCS